MSKAGQNTLIGDGASIGPSAAGLCGFFKETSGGVIILTAFLFPVVLLIAGMTIDYVTVTNERSRLQYASDAAALAGAKELSLSDANRQNVTSVVDAVVAANITQGGASGGRSVSVQSQLTNEPGTPMQVEVQLSETVKTTFGGRFGLGNKRVDVRSVAVVIGKPNICLLALEPSAAGTITLEKNAKVIGRNCAVYSNSTHVNGIKAHDTSTLAASVICSAGGRSGPQGNFQPDPLSDCPQFEDPLADRPEPTVGACTDVGLVIADQTVELGPGTFCGGLTIKGTSRVSFRPGVYTIKDGPLQVADSAAIEGSNVGFHLTGQAARLSLGTGTSISLTAPKDGPLTSLLMFGSRSQSNVQHEIMSDNARQLLGTIYLPTGSLLIDANKPIGDLSAYTAIVARTVRANSGPIVTLNSDYAQTDVPVPDGIRAAGQPVALSR